MPRGTDAVGPRPRAFTFPEALVTMVLLVAFFAVAGGLFFQGQSSFDRQDARSRLVRDEISMVARLSSICQAVRLPEWASPVASFRAEGASLSVAYLGGSRDAVVTWSTLEGGLQVTTPTGQWTWHHLPGAKVEWWKLRERIVGVVVAWAGSSGPSTLHLAWGGQAL